MKTTLSFCLIFFFGGIKYYGQSIQENNEKYWLYRQRLSLQFLVIGNGQGMSIPAAFYDDIYDWPGGLFNDLANLEVLAWSDASAHLGYYIAMLATERRVLELSGNSTQQSDEEQTLYAIEQQERIRKMESEIATLKSNHPSK